MKAPVVFLIFNRPNLTKQVFEAIRQAQPPQLFIVADGARSHKPGELEKCQATRAVVEQVDWDCEVFTNYAETNMGCGHRISSGLSWVFQQVESAIILEDDILPHPAFFPFCEQMLAKYKEDERVMVITGHNPLINWKSEHQSYHFSYYGGVWGWASWARAWHHFDFQMNLWKSPEVQERIRDVLIDEEQYQRRKKNFDAVIQKQVDCWGYQWCFARLVQSGLSVISAVNLIENLGFGEGATHTNRKKRELPTLDLQFPLKFNDFTVVDRDYDRLVFAKFKRHQGDLISRLKSRVSSTIKNPKKMAQVN